MEILIGAIAILCMAIAWGALIAAKDSREQREAECLHREEAEAKVASLQVRLQAAHSLLDIATARTKEQAGLVMALSSELARLRALNKTLLVVPAKLPIAERAS